MGRGEGRIGKGRGENWEGERGMRGVGRGDMGREGNERSWRWMGERKGVC